MSKKRLILPTALSVFLILLSEVLISRLAIPEFLLPLPSKVAAIFATKGAMLLDHSLITILESVTGLILAGFLGVIFAIALVYSAVLFDSLYPLLVVTQVLPKSALAPLLLIWLGYGVSSKLVMVFIISFFPIVVNTILGLTTVEPELLDLVRSLQAKRLQVFAKIRLPNSLPHMFGGFKIAATLSLIGAVVAEFVGAEKGLGYLLMAAQYNVNTPLMFACLVILGAIGLILFYSISLMERLFLPWHTTRHKETIYGA